ncbi:MAG: hypothetical protein FJ290_22850 [Planctomycetes bacterium]|nr:hypothetical protein [Planctomycetota bacterium]
MSSSDPSDPGAIVPNDPSEPSEPVAVVPIQPDLFWRWKWLLIWPGVVTIAVCLTLAIFPGVVRWCWGPALYETAAILEIYDPRPIGDTAPKALDPSKVALQIKTRAMSWSAIREIVLSGKVDFGREIDADDRRQFERIYSEIDRQTCLVPLGENHIVIAHRSPSPERNASLVNEIVKKFVTEDRREAQQRAKDDLKYYRDKLAVGKTALGEIDKQIREFNQQYPWLTDTLEEMQKDYEEAEADELAIRQQIANTKEAVAELRRDLAKEEPEFVKVVPGQNLQDVMELLKAAAEALRYFEQVDKTLTKAHPRWQEAYGIYERAAAALKEKGTAKPEDEKITEPNPKYGALQTRIAHLEKEMEKLEVRRLDANKRVSELYIRRRKAPELLGERQALQEQRTTAADTAAEDAAGLRLAEKQMQRLLSEPHSSRLRIIEYARDSRTPVRDSDPPGVGFREDWSGSSLTASEEEGESRKDPVLAAIHAKMLLYAGGTAAALVPAILLLVLARVSARRFERGAEPFGRAGRTLAVLAAVFCVLAPTVGIWAAVTHVLVEHPLGPEEPSTSGDDADSGRPSGRGELSGPAPAKSSGKQLALEPVSVASFAKGDIRFPQLDSDGLLTSLTHFFREAKPDNADAFTVRLDSDDKGCIATYRLGNLGTGEVHDFGDVPVKKLGGEWKITEEGWLKIRDELQAKMRVRLGRPMM